MERIQSMELGKKVTDVMSDVRRLVDHTEESHGEDHADDENAGDTDANAAHQ